MRCRCGVGLVRFWLLSVCLVCAWLGLVVLWVPGASAEELSSSLTIVGSPTEAQQRTFEEEAWLASPEGQRERIESQVRFEGLTDSEARALAGSLISGVIQTPDGGPPRLSEGQRIVGFLSPYAAQVDFGSSSAFSGLVEGLEPMALEMSGGGWAALDMTPQAVGGGFQASRGLVDATLPARLGEGAQLPGVGLSIVPVDGNGLPLSGEGVADGASVFYANSQTDTDTIMKLSTYGVASDAWLRSEKSPGELSYELGLPAGAGLQAAPDGGVDVVREGVVIARMRAPSAHDAAGYPVPVSVAISGDVITLRVTRKPGAVLYPAEVDPEFNTATEGHPIGSWVYEQAGGYSLMTGGPEMVHEGEFPANDWAKAIVTTKGDSKIYEISLTDGLWPYRESEGRQYTTWLASWFEIAKVGVESHQKWLSGNPLLRSASVCAAEYCSPAGGAEANSGVFVVSTYESSTEVLSKYGEYNPQFGGSFAPTKYISQPKETRSTVAYDTSREIVYMSEGKQVKAENALYNIYPKLWFGPHTSTAFEFESKDAGLGVSASAVEVLNGSVWEAFLPKNYLVEEKGCIGIQCAAAQREVVTWSMLGSHLANGEDKVRVSAHDPMSGTSSSEHGEGEATLRVDWAPPHNITLTGLSTSTVSEGQLELAEVAAHAKVQATDGEGSVPSSGIKSIELYVDGRQVGKAAGSCSWGPCSASAEWPLNGAELGAGQHTVTVVATDNANNVASRGYVLNVYSASPVAMGPGSVNPESGDFALQSTDVQMSGGTGVLTVSRHYDSRNPMEGAKGPLGPQWTIGLGSLASLEVLPDGSVMVIGPDGLTHFSEKSSGGFEAPVGDTSLTLEAVEKEKTITEYILRNPSKKTATRFTLPNGASAWLPTVSEGPVATDTMTDEYKTVEPEWGKKVVEPVLEVAPHPQATCAYKKLEKGCRALEFNYAETTTATGENESEWGDYKGNLTRVYFDAWDPSKGEVTSTTVAQYSYDKKGQLRAEWDPRVLAPLKTIYGYDAAGHVTAITPPGQQTTAFTYGELAGDEHPGRLLKMMRPPASTTLWNGSGPVNTASPVLSGGAFVGMRLSVSNGTWSNNPVAYSYQWFRGGSLIPGAVNANYTVSSEDVGSQIWVWVTATNGGGSAMAATKMSATVAYGGEGASPSYGSEFTSLTKAATDVATDAAGDVWVVEEGQVLQFNPEGTLMQAFGSYGTGNGQFESPGGIAIDAYGDVWVSDRTIDRIEEFTSYGEFVRAFGSAGSVGGQLSSPEGLALDKAGNVWVADEGNNRIEKFTSEGVFVSAFGTYGSAEGQLHGPYDVAVNAAGDIWVADSYNHRLEEFTATGSFIRSAGSTQLYSPSRLTIGSHEGEIWVTDSGVVFVFSESGAYKYQFKPSVLRSGGLVESRARGVAVQGARVYVLGQEPNTIATYWLSGTYEAEGAPPAYSTAFGSYGSGTGQFREPTAAADAYGNVWVADSGNNRLQKFGPNGEFLRQVGSEGTGNGQFKGPFGVAVDAGADVWVSDTNNDRVQEFNPEGTFMRAFGSEGTGNGQFRSPSGIAVDSKGNVWVADDGNGRVQEFSSTGVFESAIGSGQLSEPRGIAINSEGDLWVADTLKYRVAELSPSGVLLRSIGGSEGTGTGQFKGAAWLTIGGEGDIWVSDTGNDRVQVFSAAGEYKYQFGSEGTGAGQFKGPAGIAFYKEAVYVVDASNDRVQKWMTKSTGGDGELRPAQPGATLEYGVPLQGQGLPAMNAKEEEKWAQKDMPQQATAIFPPDEPQKWPASDYRRATVYYLDGQARTVNVASPGGAVATTEYDENNDVVRTLGAAARASALAEGCESKASCKSAEVSRLLDTQSVYAEAGARLTETLGPQHAVKIVKGNERVPSGSEVLVRNHEKYYYDEGAPTNGETYDLVTKSTDGAQTASNEEFDVRTSLTSYSGQKGLGWKLRAPTSVTTDPAGLNLTSTTFYDPTTASVTETRSPGAGVSKEATARYVSTWGSLAVAALPPKKPAGVAIGANGYRWIADSENNRLQEISATGEFVRQVGAEGTGNGQFKDPRGIVMDPEGDIWVTDTANNRVQVFSSSGSYITQFGAEGTGNGQFRKPEGIAFNSEGYVWVADTGNHRVQELSEKNIALNHEVKFIRIIGSEGTGNGQFETPTGVTLDSSGHVWVIDEFPFTTRAQEFSATGEYVRQFGSYGTGNGQFAKPEGITVDKESHVWVADTGNNRMQEFSSEGVYMTQYGVEGTGNGQFKRPADIVIDPEGHAWIADTENNRVQELSSTGSYILQYPGPLAPLKFKEPTAIAVDSKGNVWVADTQDDRIQETSGEGAFIRMFGSEGTGNGQLAKPEGVAVDKEGHVWIADTGNKRVQEFTSEGVYVRQFGSSGTGNGQFELPTGITTDAAGHVWVVDSSLLHPRVQEFSATGEYLRQFGSPGTGNGQFLIPIGIAIDKEGHVWVADAGNNRVQQFTAGGVYVKQFGTAGSNEGQLSEPYGLGFDTEGNVWVMDTANNRAQEFTAGGEVIQQFGSAGSGKEQFSKPYGLAVGDSNQIYVADTGNSRIQKWQSEPAVTVPNSPHETHTVYYTAAANTSYPACGGHIEWEGLLCQTLPVAQPTTVGTPSLATKRATYNVWDQAETITETFPAKEGFPETVRTKKTTFDPAGRPLTSEVTSSAGEPAPVVTDHYDAKTGFMLKQTALLKGEERTITSTLNTLGQLESYTDADGSTTTYSHDIDGRVTETVVLNGTQQVGKQSYTFDATTGLLTKLVDSQAGTFTASYDVAGRMTSETYPNNMTATYIRNAIGEATSVQYIKNAHCATTCPEAWYKDTIMPSVHGETISQSSALASVTDAYDEAGRLTEAQETPAGKGCETRTYAYDAEANRTSLLTRKPTSEGKCASEGGTLQAHAYDQANRLADTGTAYDVFGNTTSLPAADAGASPITSTYYVDDQVKSQTQNEQTHTYYMDPAGRTRETIASGKTTNGVSITHYAAPGSATSWISEPEGKSTRDIPGIDGTLTATTTNGTTVILLIHDLQGNVVGTASISEAETRLLSTYNSTEFGAPTEGTPPKYAWLGTLGITSESSTGTIVQDGITYVPQTGRPLQTQNIILPTPDNQATPYAETFETGVGNQTIAAFGQQVANEQQARQKTAEANQPEGETPEEEGEGEGGGCSGMNACAASVNHHHHPGVVGYHERGNGYAGCSVWTSYGSEYYTSGISGEIEIVGHWKCNEYVPKFEMQIALLVFYEGKWVEIGAPYTETYLWANGDAGIQNSHDFGCGPENMVYDAWIFGRQYDGKYKARWWSWGREAELRTSCHGGVALPEPP